LENLEVVFLLDDLTASRFVIEPFPLFLARVSLGSALSEKLLQGITSWLLRSHDQFAALDCRPTFRKSVVCIGILLKVY
jgi:hypothetical protein